VGVDGDTSNYIPNSEWTLVHLHAARHVRTYSCCAEPYPDITYVIQVLVAVVTQVTPRAKTKPKLVAGKSLRSGVTT